MEVQEIFDKVIQSGLYDSVNQREAEETGDSSRLTAAAPSMLAALEIADKFCGSLTSDECPDSVHIPIREAIEKARGAQ